jgi:two-component system sensor histidine kinase KdpD
VLSAILSVLCFDFFFVPPYLTFAVTNFRHITTFAVMLLVAVVIAGLTQRARDQAERARKSADETARARIQLEREQLRSTLLSSVSHDLRTPLAVMTGTASTLLDEDATLAPATRKELTQILLEESERLDLLVRNLLDMTRIESGAVRVKKEWQSVEEVVGAAFSRMETRLADRQITTRVPADLLAPFDGVLIEQVLVNLLENAAKYTPPDSPLEVTVARADHEIIVEVADRGPGIPPGQELRIFEKFQRGPSERLATGVGLGLAICQAVLEAHRGRIWAENRPDQGASFKFALPLEGAPLAGQLPELDENPLPVT